MEMVISNHFSCHDLESSQENEQKKSQIGSFPQEGVKIKYT